MRIWFSLAVLALAFSGCADEAGTANDPAGNGSGGAGGDGGDGSADGGSRGAAGSAGGGVGTGGNNVPTATLAASVERGSAPLVVEFTVAGDDADGDPLSWSLDVDGDGEADSDGDELPSLHTHTFNDIGTYSATLTVSDGVDPATAIVNVVVQPGGEDGQLEVVQVIECVLVTGWTIPGVGGLTGYVGIPPTGDPAAWSGGCSAVVDKSSIVTATNVTPDMCALQVNGQDVELSEGLKLRGSDEIELRCYVTVTPMTTLRIELSA